MRWCWLVLVWLLTAAPAVAQPLVVQNPVRFAWDPSPTATGYRLTVAGTTTDVGPALISPPIILTPGPYQATVVAYNAAGSSAPSSPPLVFTVTAPTPPPGCSLTIAVESFTPTVSLSSPTMRARVTYRLLNSQPIRKIQVLLGPLEQVVGEVRGEELRDQEAIGFSVPRMAGTYNLKLFAEDSVGCTAKTTASRLITVQ